MSKIGENIAAARRRLGLTQEELATRMGYKSKSTINKIELGVNDIPQSKIAKFADVLGTTPAALMGWVDPATGEKNNHLANLVVKMRRDPDFFATVAKLAELSPEEYESVKGVISAFGKK